MKFGFFIALLFDIEKSYRDYFTVSMHILCTRHNINIQEKTTIKAYVEWGGNNEVVRVEKRSS